MALARQGSPVQCIAHRGFAGIHPENTLAAVRGATEAGADAVEVDVRRCASGELVVCHDATVDRVSDGRGSVADLALADLERLDVLGTGAGIPTLSAVLDEIPPSVGLNVELKERGLARDVVESLDGVEVGDWWLSSFDIGSLDAAGQAGDDVPLALLVSADGSRGPGDTGAGVADAETTLAEADAAVAEAAALDCRAVHPHQDLVSREFVRGAHEAGLRVNAWTVRREATARRLVSAGVDGLIADAPACCLQDAGPTRGPRGSGGV